MALLVQDRVDGDRRLTGLAVPDDELALAAPDRGHRVDCLDPGLEWLADRLTAGDPGCLDLHAALFRVDERALAVDGLAQGVHDPAEQRVAYGHREDPPGRAHDLLLLDGVDRAEHDRSDGVLVEVHCEPEGAVLELEELVDLRRGQTRDPRDSVPDLHDASHLLGADRRIELGHVLAQRVGDFGGTNGELSHHSFLYLVVSIQSGFVQPSGGDGVAQRAEASAGGGVEAKIADLDQEATQQRRVPGDLQLHRLAGDGP